MAILLARASQPHRTFLRDIAIATLIYKFTCKISVALAESKILILEKKWWLNVDDQQNFFQVLHEI